LKALFRTDPGLKRDSNEDSLLVYEQLGLFAIADGMGGHAAGEVASAIAISEVLKHIRDRIEEANSFEDLIREAFFAAHNAIVEASCSLPNCSDMGTTLVVALFRNGALYLGHAGDSRAYALAPGAVTRLTKDHTFMVEWLETGTITPEEARVHPARHGLTMAVGAPEDLDPVVRCIQWNPNDILLLCSDGLTDIPTDDEISAIVSSAPDLDTAGDALVSLANRRGGEDNISLILVRL
jgi:PPM family protein phosphatase